MIGLGIVRLGGRRPIGKVHRGPAPASVQLLWNDISTTAGTTFTFASRALGAGFTTIVGNFRSASAADLVSVTIGGVTAVVNILYRHIGNTTGSFIATAPSNSGTGDIVITYSVSVARMGIAAYEQRGISGIGAHDAVGDSSGSGGEDFALQLATAARGTLIAGEFYAKPTATTQQRHSGGARVTPDLDLKARVTVTNTDDVATWVGVTKAFDQLILSGSSANQSIVAASFAPAEG